MIADHSQIIERADCAIEGCGYYPSTHLIAIQEADLEKFKLEMVCDKHYEEMVCDKHYEELLMKYYNKP
jgi:hypothetical protein